MTNPFKTRALPLNGPANDLIPVVPNDATDLPVVAASLYVETGGAITFVSVKGNTRTVTVADFAIIPVGVARVLQSGTTATGIHALTVS